MKQTRILTVLLGLLGWGVPLLRAADVIRLSDSDGVSPPRPLADEVLFWETDGAPQLDGTNLVWDWNILNNSIGTPFEADITDFRLHDIYSVGEPTATSIPETWTMATGPGASGSNYWELIFTIDFPGLYPGEQQQFTITTHRTYTNSIVHVGTRYGQGLLGIVYKPDDPGDPFEGPTGVQEPPQFSRISVTGGVASLVLTNLVQGSTCTIQRCFSLVPQDWSPVASFETPGGGTNWSEPVSNEWRSVFYRGLFE